MNKNIQVIDGADNCTYSIFQVEESTFDEMFPGDGQDIEFIEDFFDRVGNEHAIRMLEKVWKNRIDKPDVNGLHGTLFYGLDFKRKFYPNKREADADDLSTLRD
jgi:hypothetical protein